MPTAPQLRPAPANQLLSSLQNPATGGTCQHAVALGKLARGNKEPGRHSQFGNSLNRVSKMSVPGKRGPRASRLKSVLSVAGTPREQSFTERQSQRSFKSNLEHSRSHSFGGNNRGTRISAPGLERRRSTQYGNNRGTVRSRWAWPESVSSVAGTPREEFLRNARVRGHLNGIGNKT